MSISSNLLESLESVINIVPNNIAVKDEKVLFTYNEIDIKSNQVALWLEKQNIKSGDHIGLLMYPSIDLIIFILGIVKLGGVYITLDIQSPKQRINYIIKDALPKIIITEDSFKDVISVKSISSYTIQKILDEIRSIPYENYMIQPSDDSNPLCIFYTSGTTGNPKGVIISRAAANNLSKASDCLKISKNDVIGQFSNPAFDAFNFEIWGSLLNGATLFIIPPLSKNDPQHLKNILLTNHVDCILLPTAFFNQISVLLPYILDNLHTIIVGGEQINPTLVHKFLNYRKINNLKINLINAYGPTEATTITCLKPFNETIIDDLTELSSIGNPIENVNAYVLNNSLEPVANGEVGELYISGINLAIGYYNAPILTAGKFIKNPFCNNKPFEKVYKTGDLVKQLPNKELLYVGRVDDQVKVYGGNRVHLNEVEAKILQHPSINTAAVLMENNKTLHQFLVAYIVFIKDHVVPGIKDLRDFLSETLPYYMIPSKYLEVETMPLNSNNKIDKLLLKNMPYKELDGNSYNSLSDIEKQVRTIFANLLNTSNVDINRNLSELGINSLMITHACFEINQILGCSLNIADIIAYPSIKKLSRYIKSNIPISSNEIQTHEIKPLDIAIVGMACRFSGANSVDQYWENICLGKESLTRFSEDIGREENFIPVRGIIEDVEKFDANFFGFNPADAATLDPQQRLFLECAWEALEHSGNIPRKNPSKKFSIFAGMADSSYLQENLLKSTWFNKHNDWFSARIATSIGTLSTQVSYKLNLSGKSININTACSTSLVAVEQACQDLTLGYSDVALAGGVSIDLHQRHGYLYQENGIESADGKCRPFAQNANGTVFSDGLGVVILKRLKDAIKDNDTIYAVIKSASVNNDGADKLGYVAPSINGQFKVICNALDQAKISAQDIGYVETHGTATKLGDLIEFTALNQAYRKYTNIDNYCALGSVKANIGHTDIAAGMAGIIKAILCLYHKQIPPMLHFMAANSEINLKESPFYINKELIKWESNHARYAAVSAFGIGGTNAHLILKEYLQEPTEYGSINNQIFVFSAKTEKALQENVQRIINHLKMEADNSATANHFFDIAHTLQNGREEFQWRNFAIGKDNIEIIKNWENHRPIACNYNEAPPLVFMFSGQGSQYYKMAMQLFNTVPFFADIIKQCSSIAQIYLKEDILNIINNENSLINETQYTQPILFIVEYALARLMMHYGIVPQAMIGHSIGEYAAACIAEVFSLDEAIKLVCYRGALMATAHSGCMLSIECYTDEFLSITKDIKVDLALHNTPSNCVASGTVEAINKLQNILDSGNKKHYYKKLKVSHAFHSYLMDEICVNFENYCCNISFKPPQIPIISNVTGNFLTNDEAVSPKYWTNHLRKTVRFYNGINTLIKNGYKHFVEIGVGDTLNNFVKDIAQECDIKPYIGYILPSHRHETTDEYQLLTTIGELWQNGYKINWSALHGDEKRRRVPLPTYKFQQQYYWLEADYESITSNSTDIDTWFYSSSWNHGVSYRNNTHASENIHDYVWLIFKGQNQLSEGLIDTLQELRANLIVIENSDEYKMVDPQHYTIQLTEKTHYFNLFSDLKSYIDKPIIILHLFSCINAKNVLLNNYEIDHLLDCGFYSALFMLQGYIEYFGSKEELKCGIITYDSQQVTGAEKLNPINASLIGICRVVPQEYEKLQINLIDIDGNEPYDLSLAPAIANHCVRKLATNSPIIAFRNGYQWDIVYSKINPTKYTDRFRNNGVYLCTGGLGGISLTLCKKIAALVRNPIFILISRSAIPPREEWKLILKDKDQNKLHQIIQRVQDLEAIGAELYFEYGDITDSTFLNEAVARMLLKYNQINGVIHAAGVPGGGIFQTKDKESAYKVFAPKLHGTYNLAQTLQGQHLDFVMLCSSLSALVGEAGQSDYCGANACLDAISMSGLFNSDFTVSINWNTWEDTGMAINTERPDDISFLDIGNSITPEQGQRLFIQIMQSKYPQLAISKVDIANYNEIMSQRKKLKLAQKVERDNFVADAQYKAPSNQIEKQLVLLWQDILGIQQIGVEDDFFKLGGHSLKALKFIEVMNKELQYKLNLQQLYEHRTIAQLVSVMNSKNLDKSSEDIIVKLRILKNFSGSVNNIFLFHPVAGTVFCYKTIVENFKLPFNIYGLQDPSVSSEVMKFSSLLEMAQVYLTKIQQIQPSGPYYFIGYSYGGTVAHEIVNLLHAKNEKVNFLGMIDSWAIFSDDQFDGDKFKQVMKCYNKELTDNALNLSWRRMRLLLTHKPSKIKQDMMLFKANILLNEFQVINDKYNHWDAYNKGHIDVQNIEANHETIIYQKNSLEILNILEQKLVAEEPIKMHESKSVGINSSAL